MRNAINMCIRVYKYVPISILYIRYISILGIPYIQNERFEIKQRTWKRDMKCVVISFFVLQSYICTTFRDRKTFTFLYEINNKLCICEFTEMAKLYIADDDRIQRKKRNKKLNYEA